MNSRLLTLGMLALTSVTSACGGARPTVVVPLVIASSGDFALLVYDASGLVTEARQAETATFELGSATARPGESEIDISWTGGACSHRPTATTSGTPGAFRIEITNTADTNWVPFLPIACPAVGLPFTVTLSLSTPVVQSAIAFEFTP